jgi:O-antigen ligase
MSTKRQSLPGQRIRDAVLRLPSAHGDGARTGSQSGDLPLDTAAWSPRAALVGLCSFELLFVLFLFAGRIKASPFLAWLPVDLTGLLFGLSVIYGAFLALTKKVNVRGLMIAGAMALFSTWVIISLAWTPSVLYAHEKALGTVLAFWACAGAAGIIAADRVRAQRFLTIVLLFAVWFAIEALLTYAAAERRSFVELSSANYNDLGNTVACGAVIALATMISARRRLFFQIALLALLALFFYVLLVIGSRQSLLGLIGVVVIAAFMGFRPTRSGIAFDRFQRMAWGLLIAAAVGVGVATMTGESFTIGRVFHLLGTRDLDNSAAQRLVLMGQAIDFWGSAPLIGNGVGSFPILAHSPRDFRLHPHNIFLEILSEFGLIGLILFGLLLASVLRCVKLDRLRDDPLFRCIFLLTALAFSRTLVGPDIAENRLLYPLLGLLALPAAGLPARIGSPLGARPEGSGQPRWAGPRGRPATVDVDAPVPTVRGAPDESAV